MIKQAAQEIPVQVHVILIKNMVKANNIHALGDAI